jgi:hypothetical protein
MTHNQNVDPLISMEDIIEALERMDSNITERDHLAGAITTVLESMPAKYRRQAIKDMEPPSEETPLATNVLQLAFSRYTGDWQPPLKMPGAVCKAIVNAPSMFTDQHEAGMWGCKACSFILFTPISRDAAKRFNLRCPICGHGPHAGNDDA